MIMIQPSACSNAVWDLMLILMALTNGARLSICHWSSGGASVVNDYRMEHMSPARKMRKHF